jgi:NADH-quinone oxidoreductase subunit L
MPSFLADRPGLLFVAATLLPLAASAVLAVIAFLRNAARPRPNGGSPRLYRLLGGDRPGVGGGLLATGAIAGACVLSVVGLVLFLQESEPNPARWEGRTFWAEIGRFSGLSPNRAWHLDLGYRIDQLTTVMFVMITFVATLIHVFSFGYMGEERQQEVEDHEVPGEHGHHFRRRGRFGLFYLYLSLFCFSMLNLVLADNLFQVFVSWELVGVCSYFLIGFYTERPSADRAAIKAFVVNRVGDAGFLIGLAIIWTYAGTFNFQELFARLREPGELMPHALLVLAGLGVFAGCAGKSAQFPLHVWLPDAMEGPTPVSALIHAATMVAAGVYLVGRAYPLFTPEVLLVIAYTGAVTLFGAALIAVVLNDLKRVLAYSTVSQLGYMMMALGVGGWVSGELHLLTHAFFKALLFLAAGSVIYACHHEQDLRKFGGLRHKMPLTAWTMFVGVLAIMGTPFFSGWYSKDAMLADALGFVHAHPEHLALFLLPLLTAGLTAFYMLRMWFLTFTGEPRDSHRYESAHESPAVMTVPLIILAAFSLGVAWGWPIWDPAASWLGQVLRQAEPRSVAGLFPAEREAAHHGHTLAGLLALTAAGVGALVAVALYLRHLADPDRIRRRLAPLSRLLERKFYLDELYNLVFVRGTVNLAYGTRELDKNAAEPPGRIDLTTLDGWANAPAQLLWRLGVDLRKVQAGSIRRYVLLLVLTAVGLFAILSFLASRGSAG